MREKETLFHRTERIYAINPRTERPGYLGTYRIYCSGWDALTGWIRARGGKRVRRVIGMNAWLVIHSTGADPQEPARPQAKGYRA